MDLLINRSWFKWIVLVAVIVGGYVYIRNNPDVQASIKDVLRTIYLIP